MRDVEGALRQFPELTVEPGQGNAIVVDGYVREANDRARAAAIVDGFDGVTLGEVYVVNDLLATAQQTLSDTQLKVAYTGRGRMTISGVATRAVWQRVQNFKRDAKPAVEVTDQVVYDDNAGGPLIAASGGAVPVDIAGVYGDDSGTRYLVTRDGRHFFEGATLPDGLMVASIDSGSVTFERNGTRFVVALGPHEASPASGSPSGSPNAASAPMASSAAPAAAGVAMPSS
jgi:type III secretion system YscD/HrpQ family protein